MKWHTVVQVYVLVLVATRVSQCVSETNFCGSQAGWTVPSPPDGLTLQQVTAVIRHGDRVVWDGSQCWPGDDSVWNCNLSQLELPTYFPSQYKGQTVPRLFEKVYLSTFEAMNGNCSVAQLTTKGYQQHLANGRSLHKAYVQSGFMNKTLDPAQVYLRSDDIPRTLQSAQSLVLGMFPVDSTAGLSNGKSTPMVPIHTRDSTYDYMDANAVLCPKLSKYVEDFEKNDVWKKHLPIRQSLFDKIKNATGISIDNDTLDHFSDCLNVYYCHNRPLPKGLTDSLLQEVWAELSWQFYSMYKYPSVEEFASVGIGFLLNDIWKNLNDSVEGKKTQKFILFSGHDTTIMPLLVALKVDDGEWAPYASMILIELYQTKDKKSVVRIIYNGKVLSPPFCDKGLCDYGKLSSYLSTVTPPDNYKDKCQV